MKMNMNLTTNITNTNNYLETEEGMDREETDRTLIPKDYRDNRDNLITKEKSYTTDLIRESKGPILPRTKTADLKIPFISKKSKKMKEVKIWTKPKLGSITKGIFIESSKYCKGNSFSDIKQLEFFFKKFRNNSGFQALISLISILSSMMWYELTRIGHNDILTLFIL